MELEAAVLGLTKVLLQEKDPVLPAPAARPYTAPQVPSSDVPPVGKKSYVPVWSSLPEPLATVEAADSAVVPSRTKLCAPSDHIVSVSGAVVGDAPGSHGHPKDAAIWMGLPRAIGYGKGKKHVPVQSQIQNWIGHGPDEDRTGGKRCPPPAEDRIRGGVATEDESPRRRKYFPSGDHLYGAAALKQEEEKRREVAPNALHLRTEMKDLLSWEGPPKTEVKPASAIRCRSSSGVESCLGGADLEEGAPARGRRRFAVADHISAEGADEHRVLGGRVPVFDDAFYDGLATGIGRGRRHLDIKDFASDLSVAGARPRTGDFDGLGRRRQPQPGAEASLERDDLGPDSPPRPPDSGVAARLQSPAGSARRP